MSLGSSRAFASSQCSGVYTGVSVDGTGRLWLSCSPHYPPQAFPRASVVWPCGPDEQRGFGDEWHCPLPHRPRDLTTPPRSASRAATEPSAPCGARDKWPHKWAGHASGGITDLLFCSVRRPWTYTSPTEKIAPHARAATPMRSPSPCCTSATPATSPTYPPGARACA